ncbi:hypothetical protein [Alkalihalobacterium alkalinitrilicum]|uniref:hypothetical protein n=1 Tax=Alkalihalobacterium alkalinitrilicum TaxID=427920 RepID=UPI000995CF2B|nr:hypothetical protein [Alkalihalobacterium alkalinitrilicum]
MKMTKVKKIDNAGDGKRVINTSNNHRTCHIGEQVLVLFHKFSKSDKTAYLLEVRRRVDKWFRLLHVL